MPDTAKNPVDLDGKALKALTRDELDEAATAAGVPDPEALPNKGAVVEAIEAPNPALAVVADPADGVHERGYEVICDRVVLDHKPGESFTAVIPAAQEALLIESGHIKRINMEG